MLYTCAHCHINVEVLKEKWLAFGCVFAYWSVVMAPECIENAFCLGQSRLYQMCPLSVPTVTALT